MRSRRTGWAFAARLACIVLAVAAQAASANPGVHAARQAAKSAVRPALWAVPVAQPGLPNLCLVEDGLYRGAQPLPEGFRELAAMGVKTVVNLRAGHSDLPVIRAAGLGATSFALVEIPTRTFAVREDQVIEALAVLADPARRPVFVHCAHGADRTGVVIAAYRVVAQGWSKVEAIREMAEGGYGFHTIWSNLPRLLRRLDTAAIARRLALEPAAAGGGHDE